MKPVVISIWRSSRRRETNKGTERERAARGVTGKLRVSY